MQGRISGQEVGAVWGDMPASAFIQNSYLFKSLDEAGQEMVMRAGKIFCFQTGEVMVQEGEPGDMLYIIKSGAVDVFTTRDGKEILLATLSRGACVGEVSLLTGTPRTATVRAKEPVTAIGIAQYDIMEILSQYPKVKKLLESIVMARAEDTIEKTLK
ncbi:MAG: cyclic nucleotide-binding domain-containing protein [Deltaproteobacteria bacterium]|nr:cyclic nucleotide-binding domain-containing protein [Deltaproteobacteria bacterium]